MNTVSDPFIDAGFMTGTVIVAGNRSGKFGRRFVCYVFDNRRLRALRNSTRSGSINRPEATGGETVGA